MSRSILIPFVRALDNYCLWKINGLVVVAPLNYPDASPSGIMPVLITKKDKQDQYNLTFLPSSWVLCPVSNANAWELLPAKNPPWVG